MRLGPTRRTRLRSACSTVDHMFGLHFVFGALSQWLLTGGLMAATILRAVATVVLNAVHAQRAKPNRLLVAWLDSEKHLAHTTDHRSESVLSGPQARKTHPTPQC